MCPNSWLTPRGQEAWNPHLWLAKRLEPAPTPLHLEAGPIWWYDLFDQKMHDQTWSELIELGAPKMEGQFLALGPIPEFNE